MFDSLKNSKCQQFLFWRKSRQKKQFIHFLKDHYFVMGGSIDMNAGVFWATSVGFLKSVVLHFFPKYIQSYANFNVKSRRKFNSP